MNEGEHGVSEQVNRNNEREARERSGRRAHLHDSSSLFSCGAGDDDSFGSGREAGHVLLD